MGSGPSGDDSYCDFSSTGSGTAKLQERPTHSVINQGRPAGFIPSVSESRGGLIPSMRYLTRPPSPRSRAAAGGRPRGERLDFGRVNLVPKDNAATRRSLMRKPNVFSSKVRVPSCSSSYLPKGVNSATSEMRSGQLQDLRAGFTRDAIATLVRAGLLVPIVDGFDELLGTAGYSGAFSSLQSLLVQLEGLGAVVVSARSSFSTKEFLGRSADPVDQQADPAAALPPSSSSHGPTKSWAAT